MMFYWEKRKIVNNVTLSGDKCFREKTEEMGGGGQMDKMDIDLKGPKKGKLFLDNEDRPLLSEDIEWESRSEQDYKAIQQTGEKCS